MQPLACHLLYTAAVAASTTSASTSVAAAANAINYLGQSKILHLLGPPWTRTFRCIWMLEEINEEYYQHHAQLHATATTTRPPSAASPTVDRSTGTSSSSELPPLVPPPPPPVVPYYLIYNAKPLSIYVKKFHPTGKVPVLLEYDANLPSPQQEQPQHEDDLNMNSGASSTGNTILDDQNVFVLSEASAINTYLYDRYGLYSSINTRKIPQGVDSTPDAHPLVPPVGSTLRGQYDAVISCICTELDAQGLWMHRKHDVMSQQLTGSRPNPRAVFHAKDHFRRINTYLAYMCNPYLLGAHFTAADILYIHCLQWSQSIGWSNDTWPTIDVLAPINVDALKEQLRNSTTESSSRSSDKNGVPATTTPSILQPYLDLCLSRPAYQRAVQIRDGRGNDRKDTSTTGTTSNNSIPNGETTKSTASTHEEWEKEQNYVQRRRNVLTPKSRL